MEQEYKDLKTQIREARRRLGKSFNGIKIITSLVAMPSIVTNPILLDGRPTVDRDQPMLLNVFIGTVFISIVLVPKNASNSCYEAHEIFSLILREYDKVIEIKNESQDAYDSYPELRKSSQFPDWYLRGWYCSEVNASE